ncbi:MAG: undecaprenyldiphospho-muramoylpentapeptide beta-N-acetylglucosaminyltransferase [Clostridium sp.]|nr:undecaprenyldiphospho-muramoylpentapeptide beta-N-acetylglucosaminyltransferase [Clostridium sp.]
MKKIIMTGGGTAGHVTPNIALIPGLRKKGYDIVYIGSYNGMERRLIEKEGITYFGISSGKLRRYFDWKNFSDPFKVCKGFFESVRIIKKEKPNIVFSKGGFVSVPVVLAAKFCGVPAIIHESDITLGLANKIAIYGAKKVCCNFPETVEYISDHKGVLTGTPIRKDLFEGNEKDAMSLCDFINHSKPVLLIVGGSSGAKTLNEMIRKNLNALLEKYYIIHLCGQGNYEEDLNGVEGYAQFEYVNEELKDIFALSDIILSRAGANSIGEIAALAIPNILVPLTLAQSRGDQILNAKSFVKQGFSVMLEEESLTDQILLNTIESVYNNRKMYIDNMKKKATINSEEIIIDLIVANS